MARPLQSRITIVQGDYTLQTFEIGKGLDDVPYDLSVFDSITLSLRTDEGMYDITAANNDPESDLPNGIVAFRMTSEETRKLPIGRWPFALHLNFGTEVSTPVAGTAIVLDGLN